MRGYGLPMPGPLAAAVILLEAGASVMAPRGGLSRSTASITRAFWAPNHYAKAASGVWVDHADAASDAIYSLLK
jgi:hypothetical protein